MPDLPEMRSADSPKTAAFYLPQFHTIPENDEWWGEGFTEWTNVRRARPLFEGHYQPQVPDTPFGEYDLLDENVMKWQVELAERYDVDAFVFYHYWFAGRRLLQEPVDRFVQGELSHEFAICWANENWTRRWDGKEREVLLGQRYTADSPSEVFESFLPYLSDPRYLIRDGARVLLVHRADHLPQPRTFAETWRRLAAERGLGELWLVASETHNVSPEELGFDAVAEFPPVGDSDLRTALTRLPAGAVKDFRGRMCSYSALANRYMTRNPASFVRHPTVVPRWDNTPRRMGSATLYVGSTPQLYAQWLAHARRAEGAARGRDGLVFINAWNEWAEGAYLEPDNKWGHAYLDATRWGVSLSELQDGEVLDARGRVNLAGMARGSARSVKTIAESVRERVRR